MDAFMKALEEYVDAKVAHAIDLARIQDRTGDKSIVLVFEGQRVDRARQVLDDVTTTLLRRIST